MVDHIVPYARGGSHEPVNLVTTCQPCNFGRGSWLLTEVGLIDPRTRPPIIDGWDGLARLVPYAKQARLAATSPNAARQPKASPGAETAVANTPGAKTATAPRRPRKLSPDQWFAELDRVEPGLSDRLLSFLKSCEKLQVWWRLDKVMLLNMRTRDTTLNVIGILPNGDVYIPWFIDREKEKFRRFAERLVQTIPDTIVYESPKQWIVRKTGRTPVNLVELLEASTAVHAALEELCKAVNASLLTARAHSGPSHSGPSHSGPSHSGVEYSPAAKPALPGPTRPLPAP